MLSFTWRVPFSGVAVYKEANEARCDGNILHPKMQNAATPDTMHVSIAVKADVAAREQSIPGAKKGGGGRGGEHTPRGT